MEKIVRKNVKRNNTVDSEVMFCYLLYFGISAFKFILKALVIVFTFWFIMSTIDVVAHNATVHPVFWLGDNNFYNVLVEASNKLNLIMGWA